MRHKLATCLDQPVLKVATGSIYTTYLVIGRERKLVSPPNNTSKPIFLHFGNATYPSRKTFEVLKNFASFKQNFAKLQNLDLRQKPVETYPTAH